MLPEMYFVLCSFTHSICSCVCAAAKLSVFAGSYSTVQTVDVQVTHMPNLEEVLMNTVQNGSGSSKSDGEGGTESNGASRPSSPASKPSSSRQNGAELEVEQSYEGGSPGKMPHAAGLAGKAAQIFGNEAHQSSDIL